MKIKAIKTTYSMLPKVCNPLLGYNNKCIFIQDAIASLPMPPLIYSHSHPVQNWMIFSSGGRSLRCGGQGDGNGDYWRREQFDLGCLVCVCMSVGCPKQDIFNTRHLLLPCPDTEFSTWFLLNWNSKLDFQTLRMKTLWCLTITRVGSI